MYFVILFTCNGDFRMNETTTNGTGKIKMSQEDFATKVIDAMNRQLTQGEFAKELNVEKKVLTSKLAALKKICPGARIKFKKVAKAGNGARLAEMFRLAKYFEDPKTTEQTEQNTAE